MLRSVESSYGFLGGCRELWTERGFRCSSRERRAQCRKTAGVAVAYVEDFSTEHGARRRTAENPATGAISDSLLKKACVMLGVAAIICVAPSTTNAKPQTIDRVVAVIEDDIVTMRELEEKAQPFMAQLAAVADPTEREKRRRDLMSKVLDIEIGERIVNKELEKNRDKLAVGPKEVDRTIEEVLRMNNMTRDQLQAALYGQGMTWSEYRKKLREQLERANLIRFKVQGRVQVKEYDVLRRCKERQGQVEDQVCASHILFKIPEDASDEDISNLKARASQLQAEISAGGDFAAYALKHSQDTSAPDGQLGCFGRGEMVQSFEDTAYGLKVGEVSPVVRSEFGLHIIKVNDRRTGNTGTCEGDAALAPYREELHQEELERQMNVWIAELRRRAFVDVRL